MSLKHKRHFDQVGLLGDAIGNILRIMMMSA